MFTLRTDAKFDDLERLIDKISRPGNGQTRAMAAARVGGHRWHHRHSYIAVRKALQAAARFWCGVAITGSRSSDVAVTAMNVYGSRLLA